MADDVEAAASGVKPYTKWTNTTYMYDGENKQIGKFDAVEELFISDDTYVLRYNRVTEPVAWYEDRGSISATGAISGKTGFGGELSGQLIGDNKGTFLTGTGDDVDFVVMVLTISEERANCARRFNVHRPTTIFGEHVEPGVYYTTALDIFQESADAMPETLRQPLEKGNIRR